MIISQKEIREILKANPNFDRLLQFDRVFWSDANYFVAGSKWFKDEFFTWFKIQLQHYHVWDYEESWDCDKFANAFQVFSNICHAQTEPNKTESIAVGEIHYLPDFSVTYHAINCVICDDNKLKFIEPQGAEFVELSDSEQRSITFMKF